MSNNGAKKKENNFPWKEVLAFLGVIIAAYIGYLSIRSQVEIPIRATQTAEAKPTLVIWTATFLIQNTPPVNIQIPSPTLLNQEFSSLSFCYKSELDTQSFRCIISRTTFTSPVLEVCMSWIPSPQYIGSKFKRVWRNSTTGEVNSNEDTDTFGCLYWYRQEGLSKGQYDVELLVNNVIVQKGNFIIQK